MGPNEAIKKSVARTVRSLINIKQFCIYETHKGHIRTGCTDLQNCEFAWFTGYT
jgi:beta-lactamase class D